ncbi:ABC transporter substrate-binding protein [Herbaspirillum sp. alder98]|uniref:ABC transporter substrate-binding protein n=1 Tax=Herbaspirillum sp. alder98 TaxID=2913096 RepID=UPI001CD8AF55|nr:ABC transporter substrate-binding protein [Herbaspirillum sp. alder98]MCA1326858.1 ABC transporter substrate-binding protein [Herbaspirillum sp. alder98]
MKKYIVLKSVLLACSAMVFSSAAMADVKIGLSGPFSGPMAADGQEYIDGFSLALEHLGGKLGGQAVTVLNGDDQMKPDVGSQVMRKFIELDKVDAIVGLGYSNIIMANLRRLKESGVVSIAVAGGPSPMAGAECGANVFSIAYPNDGSGEAIGKLMQDKGYKNVYLMGPNYQAGKDMLAGFKRWYKGGIAAEVYTQINQTDYSAEITQLQMSKMDAIFMFYPGSMGVNFTKQLSQAGVVGKIPVYSTFTVDGTNLPALRDAAVGVISGNTWNPSLDNPENKKFVQAFEARYKRLPSTYAANAYDAAGLLDVAVRKVKGNTADKAAFAAAVKAAGAEFKSVRGPFRFNTNNMPIQNYYAFEIVKEGGQVKGKLVATPLTDHKDAYVASCPLK